MDSQNPDDLIKEVEKQRETRGELAMEALQWFLDGHVGELYPRSVVVNTLSKELNITHRQANRAISDTVGDIVDPVQQVVNGSERYVGIIEYSAYEDEGAYRYIDYDDVLGKRKRVVCAKCVAESDVDADVTHATEGEGSTSDNMPWDMLLNKVTAHYADAHTTAPETVRPGASLLNGTTISGNTSFHAGNESSMSFFDGTNLSPNALDFDGLTSDPLRSSGLIWYRSDKDVLKWYPDGSSEQRIGWTA